MAGWLHGFVKSSSASLGISTQMFPRETLNFFLASCSCGLTTLCMTPCALMMSVRETQNPAAQ